MPEYATNHAYSYQPLEPRDIRLLQISRDNEELVYTIFKANLDQAPQYFALSYTWNSQQRDQVLTCNGSTLKVSKNVLTALRYLFQHIGPLNIWIDGICINQDDESEKNVQVPMMDEIYTKTSKTIVWLGESDLNIDVAMKEIPALVPIIAASKNSQEALPNRSSPVWKGICRLLSKSWFSRLWIFQEAVLADNVDLMCGQVALPMETMINLVQGLMQASLLDWVRESIVETPPGVRTLSLIETYKRWRGVGEHFSFGALVDMGSAWSCFDPRDKIYGLLGLAEDSVRAAITVDYQTKTATQLSLDVAKHEIANEPMIGVLHLSCNRPRTADLPSWCPNYSESPTSVLVIGLASDYHAGNKSMVKRPVISARTTPFRAKAEGNILHVQGFAVDRVDKTVAPGWTTFHHTEVNIVENSSRSLAWDDVCFELSRQIFHDEALEAHSRILIGNSTNSLRCLTDQRGSYDLMKRLMAVLSGKEPEGYLHEALTADSWASVPDYMNNVGSACSNRTFFTTRDGRIGLGPSNMEAEDTVCIFCNTFTPFVIRQLPSGYSQLIGEAYVHGLMYGEIFHVREEEDLETINLA